MVIALQELARQTLFARLDHAVLEQIAASAGKRTYLPGQVIALEGEPCEAVYLVAQGVVRARQLSLEGREYVLGYLEPGACFDLTAALDDGVNLTSVDALSETVLYVIPCERFKALLRQYQDLTLAVAEQLAADVRRLSDMVKDLALHTVRTRLARFLLAQAVHPEDHYPGRRWTQEVIAAQIGTVRDVVGRTLRAFADEGLIRRERGRIVVADRSALEREAMQAALFDGR